VGAGVIAGGCRPRSRGTCPTASKIINPSGYNPGPDSYKNLPDCTASGVRVHAAIDKAGFTVELKVPFSFLIGPSYKNVPTDWRANFYRWDMSPRNLTAWSPTSCDGVWPCNASHVPKYFGHLKLVGGEQARSSWGSTLAAFGSAFDLRSERSALKP
jgi:hypothetical protein